MGKLKLFFFVLLCVVLLSCQTGKNKLRIGLNADYPPFEYRQDGVLTGIDVELARKLGESLGYSIEFVEMEFDELFPALEAGQIDLAVSAITINNQRRQVVDFSIPYFNADQALITLEDNNLSISKISDIIPYRIGMQNGTTGQYFLQYNEELQDNIPWQNLSAFDNNNQAISALMNQKVDLLIMDDTAAEAFCQIKPLKVVHLIKTDEQYGIAMPKNSQLKDNINEALKQIVNSRYWTTLITKYMGK